MAFAFIFESIGGTEWLVLLGVVLIVVGPKNLPAAARKMGQIMSQIRRAADEFKRQLMAMDQEVTRTVNDYVNTEPEKETNLAGEGTDSSGNSQSGGDSADDPNYYDPYGDGNNPYPGHGEGYYDETYYQPASEGAEETGGAEAEAPAAETVAEAKEADKYAIKVTVSKATGGGDGGKK